MSKRTRTHRRELDRASETVGLFEPPPNPLGTLVAIARERDRLAELEAASVLQLRSVGVPWSVIGRSLGITGQAVSKRYASLLADGSDSARR